MEVPFFDMKGELAPARAGIDAAIARVLDSGVFIGGPEVQAFERELASATASQHAIGVSSGTDALHVLGLALDIGAGRDVVTTPLTFFATAGSFARLGARIVFADISDETLCLDPVLAASACDRHTAAVVTVSLFGHPAPVPAGLSCPLLEDGAQSLGARATGCLATTLSFFPTKNIGAVGDAGAVLTDSAELAASLRLLREHGAKPKYHHVALGGNFRLDALQAAVLRARLAALAEVTTARRSCAERYRALFQASPLAEVRLPANHPDHVHHQFVIRVPRRDGLRTALAARGVATQIYYPEPLHLQPCFADLGYRPGSCPVAETVCREALALPCRPTLTGAAQEYIVEQITRYFRG